MRVARLLLAAALLAGAGGAAPAQEGLSLGQVQSPILTIDVDRLLEQTLFGRRLSADLRARGEALAAENRRIEAELAAEEQSLTERRPGMEPDAFRAEADAFDAKVQRVRAEQDAKQRAWEAALADGRRAFLGAATPALERLMVESGAAVILDRREVFLSATAVNVTDEAIAAIDAELGDGVALGPREGTVEPEPAPASDPVDAAPGGG